MEFVFKAVPEGILGGDDFFDSLTTCMRRQTRAYGKRAKQFY
jgi:hypothetical protein